MDTLRHKRNKGKMVDRDKFFSLLLLFIVFLIIVLSVFSCATKKKTFEKVEETTSRITNQDSVFQAGTTEIKETKETLDTSSTFIELPIGGSVSISEDEIKIVSDQIKVIKRQGKKTSSTIDHKIDTTSVKVAITDTLSTFKKSDTKITTKTKPSMIWVAIVGLVILIVIIFLTVIRRVYF